MPDLDETGIIRSALMRRFWWYYFGDTDLSIKRDIPDILSNWETTVSRIIDQKTINNIDIFGIIGKPVRLWIWKNRSYQNQNQSDRDIAVIQISDLLIFYRSICSLPDMEINTATSTNSRDHVCIFFGFFRRSPLKIGRQEHKNGAISKLNS